MSIGDALFRDFDILIKTKLRPVKADFVVSGVNRLFYTLKTVGVIGIRENRHVIFLTQASNKKRRLSYSEKIAFPFRETDNCRDLLLHRGTKNSPHHSHGGSVKMADCGSLF